MLSVRRDTQRGFGDVRRRCEEEPELLRHGPAYVLYALMDAVVDRYFPVLDALTEEIEQIEERIFAGQTTRASIEALYGLKRKLMTARARGRAAARGHRQAARRPRAADAASTCRTISATSTTT